MPKNTNNPKKKKQAPPPAQKKKNAQQKKSSNPMRPKTGSQKRKEKRDMGAKIASLDKKTKTTGIENFVGKVQSNDLKGIVKKVQTKVSLAVTSPSRRLEAANTRGFALFVAHWIGSLIREKPQVVCLLGDGTGISPKDLWAYAFICLYSMGHKHGSFVGNQSGSLPAFDELQMPIALAKIIELMAPYKRDGVEICFQFAEDLSLAISGSTALDSTTALWPPSFSRIAYDQMQDVPSGGSVINFQQRANAIFPFTWVQWIQNRLAVVQTRLAAIPGVKMVKGEAVTLAPDSAAHATLCDNCIVSAHSRKLNWAIAQVFAVTTPVASPYCIAALMQGVCGASTVPLRPSVTAGTTWSAEDQICATFVWICHHADEWKSGDVLRLRVNGQKIKSLLPMFKRVYGVTFYELICAEYKAMQSMNPSFSDNSTSSPTSSGVYAKLTEFIWVVLILLHRRLSLNCPLDIICPPTPGGATFPQAFTNSGLDGVLIPVAIQEYINSNGAVLLEGKLVFPCFATDNAQPLSNYQLTQMSSVNPAYKGAPGVNDPFKFPYTMTSWSTTAPSIVVGGQKYDAALDTNLVALYNAQNGATLWPFGSFSSLVADQSTMYATIGNIAGNMVSYSPSNWGCNYQMYTQGVSRTPGTSYIVSGRVSEKLGAAIPTDATAIYLAPTNIISAIPLNGAETVQALAYAADASVVEFVGPHMFQGPNNNVAANFLVSTAAQSFTPNLLDPGTDLDQPGIVHRDGVTMMLTTVPDDVKAVNVYGSVLCTAAQALSKSAPFVCTGADTLSAMIPFVGSFLKGNVKGLCESGISSLVSYVGQRCVAVSHETQKIKTNENNDFQEEMEILANVAGLTSPEKKQLLQGALQVFGAYMKAKYSR